MHGKLVGFPKPGATGRLLSTRKSFPPGLAGVSKDRVLQKDRVLFLYIDRHFAQSFHDDMVKTQAEKLNCLVIDRVFKTIRLALQLTTTSKRTESSNRRQAHF